jgi:hypothetical protein
MNRRNFIRDSAVSALAVRTAQPHIFEAKAFGSERSSLYRPLVESGESFWPEGARVVVSISMQMEAPVTARHEALLRVSQTLVSTRSSEELFTLLARELRADGVYRWFFI